MRRFFPVLAVVAVLTLLFSLVLGMLVPLVGSPTFWLVGFMTIAGTHALAGIFLEATGHQIAMLARSGGLPDWVPAQAEKNRRKALVYLLLGLPLFPLVTLLKARGLVGDAWSLGVQAFNLAFQSGAFVAEFAIMGAQARLLRDVGGWVVEGSPREAGGR